MSWWDMSDAGLETRLGLVTSLGKLAYNGRDNNRNDRVSNGIAWFSVEIVGEIAHARRTEASFQFNGPARLFADELSSGRLN
ncbi:hypothetical protein FG05_30320 [Fusarium graminearum]|nr:hypothetical protein FG05_30320 [Fusarium graminearum]